MYIYLPSKKEYQEISSEKNYLWFVQADNREEATLLLKATTPIIKAIIQGCYTSLLFTKVIINKNTYLITEFLVIDTSDKAICISNIQRGKSNYTALSSFIKNNKAKIVLYNELSSILASTNVKYEAVTISGKSINEIILKNTVSTTNDFNIINKILDTFDNQQHTEISSQSEYILRFEEWLTVPTVFPSLSSSTLSKEYDIKSLDDGAMQENAIISIFNHIYSNIYHSPTLKNNNKTRELTDVLIDSPASYILFESKSLGVNKNGYRKRSSRNSSNIKKHTRKAFDQLVGAIKSMLNCENSIIVITHNLMIKKIILPSYL